MGTMAMDTSKKTIRRVQEVFWLGETEGQRWENNLKYCLNLTS